MSLFEVLVLFQWYGVRSGGILLLLLLWDWGLLGWCDNDRGKLLKSAVSPALHCLGGVDDLVDQLLLL